MRKIGGEGNGRGRRQHLEAWEEIREEGAALRRVERRRTWGGVADSMEERRIRAAPLAGASGGAASRGRSGAGVRAASPTPRRSTGREGGAAAPTAGTRLRLGRSREWTGRGDGSGGGRGEVGVKTGRNWE